MSRRPVRTLINTHHHGDHTFGNWLCADATIVAQERCREEVLAGGLPNYAGVWDDVEWGALELAPPFLTDPERIVGNLHRAYAELSDTPRGGAINLAAALGDMITYNGGRPLACRA